jgi:excisionase family DNA binding protein
MSGGRLHPDDVHAIARAVVELLGEVERPKSVGALLTASEAAERLGVTADYVYRHADELGARRLGSGPRARLRFPEDALDAWTARDERKGSQSSWALPDPAPRSASRRRASRVSATEVELLPIRRPPGGAS